MSKCISSLKLTFPELLLQIFWILVSTTYPRLDSEGSKGDKTGCPKHGKALEAFWEEDQSLLCITCILNENHKSHTLQNISDSYEKYFKATQSEITTLLNQKHEIWDTKIILGVSWDKIEKEEKQEWLKEVNEFFGEIIQKIQIRQKEVLATITAKYNELQNDYHGKVAELERQAKVLEQVEGVRREVKEKAKLDFLNWYTSKANPLKKVKAVMGKGVRLQDVPIHKCDNIFSREEELKNLSKLLWISKSPLDVLRTKNMELNSLNRDYRTNVNRNGLNKCYSVNELKLSWNRTMISPCASQPKLSMAPSTPTGKKPVIKKPVKRQGGRVKTQQKQPKQPQNNVLAFLRKNSKINNQKLKCAQRTQIDLKSLNYDQEDIDDTYFSETRRGEKVGNQRGETSMHNYVTEPRTARGEDEGAVTGSQTR